MTDINEAMQKIGWTRYHYYSFFVCGCSWAGDMIWSLNVSIAVERASSEWNLSSFTSGALLSCFMIGMLIGSYVCGHLSDKFGRMFVFKKVNLIIILGGLLAAFSVNFWMLLLGLFLIGAGVGGEIAVGATIYS